MDMNRKQKDYFSFESIRDGNGEVICYHVTMIGTIEADGVPRLRTDMGPNKDGRRAFGRLTLVNCDRKIKTLLDETDSYVASFYSGPEGSESVIGFTARDWRADAVYELSEGDRVLVEGRAYFRQGNDERGRKEFTVTVTGTFLIGRKRKEYHSLNEGLVPQKY